MIDVKFLRARYAYRPFTTAMLALCVATGTAGCVATAKQDTPASDQRAWQPPAPSAEWKSLAIEGVTPQATVLPDADKEYDLAALIDLAQRNNPTTRLAWIQARQAATAIGMTDASFLPMLSAYVVGGYQSTRRQRPEVLGRRINLDSSVSGVVPLLTLEWLLFDFGQRAAANQAARHLSWGSNYVFNAAHQTLIYEVTRKFYDYGTARERTQIARESLANNQSVNTAVEAKRRGGLATSVEAAQARQLVAQGRLRLVTSEGAQRNAYQALAATLNLDPDTPIRVAQSTSVLLPTPAQLPEGSVLRRALADRPDVMASVASLQAAKSGVDVARAAFMPKLYMAGFVAGGSSSLELGALPALNRQSATSGVLLGLAIPLYDAGLRSARLVDAQDRVRAAEATLDRLRTNAMHEMAVAATMLETALQSYEAASSLTDTATLTYDAALDAYKQGVGTVTLATEAANGLLTARAARSDARGAALVAAATLAFALGQIDMQTQPGFKHYDR